MNCTSTKLFFNFFPHFFILFKLQTLWNFPFFLVNFYHNNCNYKFALSNLKSIWILNMSIKFITLQYCIQGNTINTPRFIFALSVSLLAGQLKTGRVPISQFFFNKKTTVSWRIQAGQNCFKVEKGKNYMRRKFPCKQ